MMKYMIASDIHGSAHFCRQLMDRFKAEVADKLIILGDILYHGPRNDLPTGYAPKEVISMLNPIAERIIAVRGNCEAEVDQMVLSFPIMADYAVIELEKCTVFATHGHVYSPDKLPPFTDGSVFLSGHTHIPTFGKVREIYCFNPGSVSIPKEGSAHGYMTYENGVFSWKDLSGETYREVRL